MLRTVVGILVALLGAACQPYFYDGYLGVLEAENGLDVTSRTREWGDCYNKKEPMPVTYELKRPEYTLHVAHGARYWPDFYFAAETGNGVFLDLSGEVVAVRRNADHRRLETARELTLTHHTGKLRSHATGDVLVEIRSEGGQVIGRERLTYRIVKVECFEWDAL